MGEAMKREREKVEKVRKEGVDIIKTNNYNL